jgi:hypothetical protein
MNKVQGKTGKSWWNMMGMWGEYKGNIVGIWMNIMGLWYYGVWKSIMTSDSAADLWRGQVCGRSKRTFSFHFWRHACWTVVQEFCLLDDEVRLDE